MNGRDTYRIEQRINTDMMIVRRRYFTHLDTSRACTRVHLVQKREKEEKS